MNRVIKMLERKRDKQKMKKTGTKKRPLMWDETRNGCRILVEKLFGKYNTEKGILKRISRI
jgi:hypothetical protein